MEKKYAWIAASTVVIFLGVLVYALAVDSDGGLNYGVQGTCSDNSGNHTDFCETNTTLMEYYPNTNSTMCILKKYNCNQGNTTMCVTGHCI